MKCPRVGCEKDAIIDKTYGVLPCRDCRAKDNKHVIRRSPEFYSLSKKDRIQRQRDTYAKDILQPWEGRKPSLDFVKAYPDKREVYFDKSELNKL